MSFDAETLFKLLPAIYRIRDADLAGAAGTGRGPLEEIVAIFAEQIAVVEENLEQLYDDLFIETCAEWVVPYIGDLIGYQSLHGVAPGVASPRAEVAHTIALRRRKGTALVLEQLARDVTGWNARAVEYFQLLATTQYMNHPRLHSCRCPDLRDGEALEWIGTAFESAARSVDVRRIESGRGRHNIPNVGLFLWRINAYPHRDCPAVHVGPGCYRVSPLNHDIPLYSLPQAEEDITHLAEPFNVPWPLSRRHLRLHLDRYYGQRSSAGAAVDNASPSLILAVNGVLIERDQIDVCDLSGTDPDWPHQPPAGRYSIDPLLGRVALPPEEPDPSDVRVTWHEGFSADLGGGEYERGATLPEADSSVPVVTVSGGGSNLTAALSGLSGSLMVVIEDSDRYDVPASIQIPASSRLEIRAGAGRRPTLTLNSPLVVAGGADSGFTLNGLLLAGDRIQVPADPGNTLASLELTHCTLVPGLALTREGRPENPDDPSLEIEIAGVEVEVYRSILGGVRAHEDSTFEAIESVLDATDMEGVAFAAPDAASPGAALSLNGCTIIGKIHARELGTISESILFTAQAIGDTWPAPVRTERKQVGCVRFSYLPFDSIVPRRYRCQPDSEESADSVAPGFTSLSYGTPAYCQLTASTPDVIRRGAEDESEMGVFHHLAGALRETNLRTRLTEYLRVGLCAGIFYES